MVSKVLQDIITGIDLARIPHNRGGNIVNIRTRPAKPAAYIAAVYNILVPPSLYKAPAVDINQQRNLLSLLHFGPVHMDQRRSGPCINLNIFFPVYLKLFQRLLRKALSNSSCPDFLNQFLLFRRNF